MTSTSPNDIMRRAVSFASELPDLHNVRKTRNSIVFEYVADGELPPVKWKYQTDNIDRLAMSAWKKIFSSQERIQLLRKNYEIVFIVYFWYDNHIIGDLEFCYSMSDQPFKLQVA